MDLQPITSVEQAWNLTCGECFEEESYVGEEDNAMKNFNANGWRDSDNGPLCPVCIGELVAAIHRAAVEGE